MKNLTESQAIKVRVIMDKNSGYGTINNVVTPNNECISLVIKFLKKGNAKLIIDTNDTIMYHIY